MTLRGMKRDTEVLWEFVKWSLDICILEAYSSPFLKSSLLGSLCWRIIQGKDLIVPWMAESFLYTYRAPSFVPSLTTFMHPMMLLEMLSAALLVLHLMAKTVFVQSLICPTGTQLIGNSCISNNPPSCPSNSPEFQYILLKNLMIKCVRVYWKQR